MKIQEYVQRSLLFAIASGYDSIWRDFNARLKKEDCNFLDAVILISLFLEPEGAATPSDLAQALRTSRGNISHCLSRLQKRGLLRRNLSDTDARSYELTLKPEGRKLALRLIKTIDRVERFFDEQYGKEEVLKTIEKIGQFAEGYRRKHVRFSEVK